MSEQMKMVYCSKCGFGHWVRECPTCGHIENQIDNDNNLKGPQDENEIGTFTMV